MRRNMLHNQTNEMNSQWIFIQKPIKIKSLQTFGKKFLFLQLCQKLSENPSACLTYSRRRWEWGCGVECVKDLKQRNTVWSSGWVHQNW